MNDLRMAQKSDQFDVYFQPIIDLKTNQITKSEALIRWKHPNRGLVNPLDFIPLAEEIGLINEISTWVFHESTQRANQWIDRIPHGFQMSVNLSPVQFKLDFDQFKAEWIDYLTLNQLSGKNIVVEITEGLLLDAEPEILEKLLWLRDAGVQVAIDDFGTGYSSLSYLNKFDIDYLKIDKSFVKDLETNENDVKLCDAIIVMAHTLGLKVIAEGVETVGQKEILTKAGCDFGQGYYFSKPVSANEFEDLLPRYSRKKSIADLSHVN